MKNGDYVIVRASQSGVWAGVLTNRNNDEVLLSDARRIWYWDGAASLSELATRGTSRPENCKFPAPVNEVLVLGVCEVIAATPEAKKSIEEVAIWSKH